MLNETDLSLKKLDIIAAQVNNKGLELSLSGAITINYDVLNIAANNNQRRGAVFDAREGMLG